MARAKNYAKLIESIEKKISANQIKIEKCKEELSKLEAEQDDLVLELENTKLSQLQAFMEAKSVSISDIEKILEQM